MASQALCAMFAFVCVLPLPPGRSVEIVNSVTKSNPASFKVKYHLVQVTAS